MDYTDYKIIEILLEDGRIPMKELAKRVALSAPAVAERVKRLEEENIITGYKAKVNYEKLGKKINVLINIDISGQRSEKFKEFIENEDAIVECHHVTGPYCKILKARLEDISSLETLIGKIQMFGNTETFIILSSSEKENLLNPEKDT
ncbi:Lrp/AsnC family transcriptional regulator, leucine-responsive regulatory protein [Clostridium cavendishii DSM 21758]|uniref:Lrp/AsnC family transcriptional regulator, leucine-responsive regulatory protein n=1 Tax=Clostridium cavendishii DSM 21758 TaxID=1121302 RepID=A0A1M6HLK0_9CLOT|nr:Lrp/AsnC family transcriptional regulator [Clostridium cavendishii]SHJ23088.1 Lrp/AsnC family transcriptional regulator, leucine-responsive regulatory protein [Clostridium cavendishii DSM 21758]